MPPPRKPRIRARLAGPSGLAAALALGAAGPASASVHRAAVAGPGPGWGPTAAAAAPTDSPLGALAVLGACGLAGFILLLLGRRKDVDEPIEANPPPPDLEALMQSARIGPDRRSGGVARRGDHPAILSATGTDGAPAPIWVRRLNDQAPPPPEPTRVMDGAYRG
jgi:hypothetical protein